MYHEILNSFSKGNPIEETSYPLELSSTYGDERHFSLVQISALQIICENGRYRGVLKNREARDFGTYFLGSTRGTWRTILTCHPFRPERGGTQQDGP